MGKSLCHYWYSRCAYLPLVDNDGFKLLTFISVVSGFLGPIFAVMVVDYYLVHNGNYNLTRLYDVKTLFSPFKGWNPAAIISIGVGTVFSFMNVDLSWLLGIIPAGITYFVLMKFWVVKHESYVKEGMEQRFQKAIVLEDEDDHINVS
jgi:NCS1 family nucleobase:cation symporter-1